MINTSDFSTAEQFLGGRIKRSLVWNIVLPVILQIFRLFVSIIIARLLEPKDFGIMSIASILIFYTNNLTNFGFGNAIVQRYEIEKRHINSVFSFNLIISIILLLLTIIFSNKIADFFKIPELSNVLYMLSIIFILTSFYLIPSTLLRRDLNFKLLSGIEFLNGFIQSIITLFLALLGFGYWALAIGLVSGHIVVTLLINLKTKYRPKLSFSYNTIKELLHFSAWNFMMGQMETFVNYIDKFIIGKFLGPTKLGFYDKAFSFSLMPFESISRRIGSVMFSSFSRSQKQLENLKDLFIKSVSSNSLICYPIFIGLASISPYFVDSLLGDKWTPMIYPLQILCLSYVFNSSTSLILNLNVAIGKYKKQGLIQIIHVIMVLIFCISFVKIGINYVALGILLGQVIWFFLTLCLTKNYLPLSLTEYFKAIIPALLGSTIMFIIIKTLSLYFFSKTSFTNLLILSFIGLIFYVMWILIVDFKEIRFLKVELRLRSNRLFTQFIKLKI